MKFLSILCLAFFILLSAAEGCSNIEPNDQETCNMSLSELLKESYSLKNTIENGMEITKFNGLHLLKAVYLKQDQQEQQWVVLKYWDKTKIGQISPLEIEHQHALYEIQNCTGNTLTTGNSEENAFIKLKEQLNLEEMHVQLLEMQSFKYRRN